MMSSFSCDEDLFRDYDDIAPLSSIINQSVPSNNEFDLNEFSGSAQEFFNYQANDNDVTGSSTIPTTQDSTESNGQNSELNWDALNGSVGDFFNGLSNDNNAIESDVTSTSHLFESPSIVSNLPVIAQSTEANYRRNSPDSVTNPSQVITRFNYEKVKGISSQRCRRFPDILPEDKKRDLFHKSGHQQLWFFILNLLNDFTKKSVIIWTGNQRHFRIKNTDLFCHLWSMHKGVADVQWDSVQRTMRTCGKNGMLMAVPSMKHRGRNEDGVYGYVIEISSYLNMTRQELDRVISLHSETGPLTVGSPIDSSLGYPEGTKLKVMPIMPLDNEGNLLNPIPDHFITVFPQSINKLTPSIIPSSVSNHPQQPTPNFENIQPAQSTPIMNSLLNIPPSISAPSNNSHQPTPPPAISPMQLAAVNIDFSQIFNNDGTMNIVQRTDGGFISSVVPLDYLNQPFPVQNQFQPHPIHPFHPLNHQLHSVNNPYQVQHQPFYAHNQPLHH